MRKALVQANTNARFRDLQLEVNLDAIEREEKKANEQGYTIVKKRDKNKAGFVQIIQENYLYLLYKGYLTGAEMAFLSALSVYAELHTNAIVQKQWNSDGYFISTGQFCTVSYLAKELKRNKSNTSKLINSLLSKGVLYEFINAHELKEYGRVVSERPLFLNPEIVYCGDRNRINATLCRLVINADPFEKKKIKLPWKIWLKPEDETGKLYRRKTYLKYKKSR